MMLLPLASRAVDSRMHGPHDVIKLACYEPTLEQIAEYSVFSHITHP